MMELLVSIEKEDQGFKMLVTQSHPLKHPFLTPIKIKGEGQIFQASSSSPSVFNPSQPVLIHLQEKLPHFYKLQIKRSSLITQETMTAVNETVKQ